MRVSYWKILLVLTTISLMGCRSGFYYATDEEITQYKKTIVIDSSSALYIRTLYTKENEFEGRELTTNKSDEKGQKNFLVEVQFLILNKNNEAIYISTIPSKYIFDKSTYLIPSNVQKTSYPNCYFFNSFFIGEYQENKEDGTHKLIFENNKTAQNWQLVISNDKKRIDLKAIHNYVFKKVRDTDKKIITAKIYTSTEDVDESFSNSVQFERVMKFDYLYFRDPYKRFFFGIRLSQITNKICIYFKDAEMKKVSHLTIPFEYLKPGFKTMKFKSGRVRYF